LPGKAFDNKGKRYFGMANEFEARLIKATR
jgi:hypothetical protein